MELLRSVKKEAMSVGAASLASALVAVEGMFREGSSPSIVNFLCLRMIFLLSWLGEGRVVALASTGACNSMSTHNIQWP